MSTKLQTPRDFKSVLQEELVSRTRKNSSYSLRAFAKSLGLTSSALSEMLNGKRAITYKSIEKIGIRLGMSLNKINSYKVSSTSKNESQGSASFRQINIDQYSVISDWYHYAIIELLKVKGMQSNSNWISRSLSITRSVANIAIDRLVRLKLIEWKDKNQLVDTSSGFSTNISENLTSNGSKQLQKQILEQSIDALMNVPLELRNHTSMTMAINPKHLPEAIVRLTKFRRELCEYLESQGDPLEVYQLSLSIFPITNISNISKQGENV
jgi:uncharacterized protein (TIGR02147 family)